MAKRLSAELRDTGHSSHTELNDDFSEVVRMPRPREKANIADLALVRRIASEKIFLDIRHAFQNKSDGEQDDPSYISPGAECRLIELGNIGRIEDGDR